jgi:DNA-binding Lrp family transcriptional regulator
MTWAWKVSLKSTDKLMLLALCDHADDENFQCWPSITHLQKKTGLSRQGVCAVINRLVDAGLVEKVGIRENGNRIYQVRAVNLVDYSLKETQEVVNEVDRPSQSDGLGVVNDVDRGSQQSLLEIVNDVDSKPSDKPPNNPQIPDPPPARARAESAAADPKHHPPMTPGDWAQYFIERCGYPLHIAMTPKTMAMFRQWIAEGVTVEEVEDAALVAEAKHGGIPSSPMYYRGFVAELRLEKQRAKENPASMQPWPGESKQQNRRNYDGRDQAYRQGRCPKTGRKLAPGELSLLQEREYAERQRAKQARVINPRPDGFDDFETLDEDEQSLRPSLAIDLWQCH